MRPGTIHHFIDGFQKFIWHKRLPDIGEACWNFINETGNQNYWETGERVLDRVRQIDSVHLPRHLNIGNQQVNLAA